MNLFDLSGKCALVTGAGRGLGERYARILAAAGARVILTSCKEDMKQLKIIESELENSISLELDVSDKQSVQRAFKEIEKREEKIDICINNAGIAPMTPIFLEDEFDDFERVISINFMGVWYVTKSVANHMKNHKIKGSIINIGSIVGNACPALGGAAYSVSKAAVMHLTRCLVGELSPHQIRINSICPGFVLTDMTKDFLHSVGEEFNKKIPLGYVANTNDLDATILYLASNKASNYVTGSCVTIDGGISWGGG